MLWGICGIIPCSSCIVIKDNGLGTFLTIFALLLFPLAEPVDSVMLGTVRVVSSVKQSSASAGCCSSTTLGRAFLESANVNSVKELTAVVPNFYQPCYGSRMTSSLYVRGFGSRIDQPVVGMNIDELPLLNKNCYDFELFDIDNIEVVRGAQGLLYGRNTSGGTINITTLSPFSFQGKRLSLEYGNENNIRFRASHYSRHSGCFAWSASLFYSHSDGFFTNSERGEKCDGGDNLSMRVRLQFLPTDAWSIDNSLVAGYTDEGGWAYRFYDKDSRQLQPVAYNDPSTYRRFTLSNGLVVKHYLDNATLSSVTGYQYMNDRMRLDNDFLPLDYFSMGQYQKEHSLTQEFVIKSYAGRSFSFLGGLFGFFKHNSMSAPVRFKQYGIDNLVLKNANDYYYHLLGPDRELSFRDDNFVIEDDFTIPTFGAAAYLQLGYSIGGFNFQGGLRVDYEHSKMDYDSHSLVYYKTRKSSSDYTPLNSEFSGSNSQSALELMPSFSLSYSGKWGSVYASARRGFKAGGYNTQLFSDILQSRMTGELVGNSVDTDASSTEYKPETSWHYELGTHLSPLSNGSLNISASLFYIDCRNQQLTVFPKGMSTGRMMSNAGKSYSYGGELLLSYVYDRLTVNAAAGYTCAKFREYESGNSDYSGKVLPFAPRETFSANIAYRLPVAAGFANSMVLNVGWSGVGRIYWNEENTLSQPFYGLWSASLEWSKGVYGVSLWAKNIFDKEYNTFYFRSIGNDFFAQGMPLQFGIKMSINI